MAYIESVIIRDTGGTEVDGSAVTQPVNIVAGSVTASVDLQQDVFGQLVIANRYNQFEINYDSTDPDSISDITVTKTSGGDASNLNGQAVFTSNANTNGGVKAVTNLSTTYRPNSETYAAFTAIWPSGGLANSYQRIGVYDANNGFFIGYEGTAFGITLRKATVDTFTAQASWNVDTLTGAVGSKYTRNGVPEAIDFTKDNLFRVRYGWLGAAPIYWEVLSPDGEWVLFDIYRHPNTTGGTTINNPDLPMTLDIQKTAAGATVLTMNTACWAAGTTSPYTKISSTITDNTLANMSRSVITGRSSTGGGTYYNVKVNPSGSLVTTADFAFPEDSAHASGDTGAFVMAVRNDANTAMTSTNGDYSPIAVNANGAVAINDGGNSITVDGSVTATVSGTVTADINVAYNEDTAHSPGDKGAFILGVRNDNQSTTFTSNNADYSPIAVDDKGRVNILGSQDVNLAHVGGAVVAGAVDNVSGNVLVTNIYDLANNDALVVGLADSLGDLVPADKLIQTHKSEDSPAASGDYGNFVLAVRNDANAVVTSTDGDYSQISVNDKGAVAINDGGNSITVDGSVTSTISGTVSVDIVTDSVGLATEATLLQVDADVQAVQNQIKTMQYTEDSAFSDGDTGVFVLAVRNDTNTVFTSTDLDYSPISVNNKGAVAIQDGGGTITVDGTVAFSNTTIAVTQATAASLNATVVQGTATNLKTQAENYQGGTAVGAANPLQVSLANTGANATAVKVDGSAVTQPISGTVTAAQATAANLNATVVQGTATNLKTQAENYQGGTAVGAANPLQVSLANTGANATAVKVDGSAVTQPVSGTVTVTQATAANLNATVTPPTLTKGTQGATGFSTQDLKDAGRTAVRYYATAAAAGATTVETAITLTRSSGTSATSTAVSWTPTSGKTFRIQAISFATRGNATATAQTTTFNFRINTAGAVTTTSTPIILAMRSATPATANAWDRILLEIPDGIEIAGDGTLQFGITAAATYTTNAPTWDVTIVGFEY